MIKIELLLERGEYAALLPAITQIEAARQKREDEYFQKAKERDMAYASGVASSQPAPGVYSEEQLQRKMDAIDAIVTKAAAQVLKAEAPKVTVEDPIDFSSKPTESAAPGVTYDDLKASIMKLVAKSPAQMKEVCEAFGLKTFAGTTDPVLWAKAKEMIDAKVAG